MGSSSGEGWPTSARSPIVASMPATALFSLTCSSRGLAARQQEGEGVAKVDSGWLVPACGLALFVLMLAAVPVVLSCSKRRRPIFR